MTASPTTPREKWTALGILVLGVGGFVGVVFGPDWVQNGVMAIYAALLLRWIVPDLRDQETSRGIRVMMWIGVVGAVVLILVFFGELLF